MNSAKPPAARRNWLLAKSRQWHLWGGVAASLFILIAGASGIVLNYKKPIFAALGLEGAKQPAEKVRRSEAQSGPKARLTSAEGFAGVPVSAERVLEIARAQWGTVTLERIELKDEHGELTYKVKRKSGEELWVNAISGSHFLKGEYERGKSSAAGSMVRTTDWGKIILDFHTGKIGGETGKAVMSVAALLLLFLTFSGIYMWVKPILIRRENAKAKKISSTPPPGAAQPPQTAVAAAVPAGR